MNILIKNGRMVDPASGTDDRRDILIENGIISSIAREISPTGNEEVIDASGCIVLPGLIDIHVHFREPGREDKETILGGSIVAAKSGYTSVCTMPNTSPVIDNQALVRFVSMEGERGPINVYPIATISKGSKGGEISEMGELINGGAVGFSDDGLPVMSPVLMRRALEYGRLFDVPMISHAEDSVLSDDGIMNEGKNAILLGLKGIPRESEEIMIYRDAVLARLTKGKLHICHVSSGGSVDIIQQAKNEGIRITCETAPHYFSLTDDAVEEHLSMAKMNPPLRTEEDRQRIIEGLRTGVIDVIATDHAPHLEYEKMQEIEYAPFGIVGLETAVPLIITELIKNNGFSYIDAFAKVTSNPSRIMNLGRGELQEGLPGDVTVIDPEEKVLINNDFFVSKCKNSPFLGKELYGKVRYTICKDAIAYSA